MTGGSPSGPTLRFRRVAALPFQTLAEETLVVNPRTREVHLLNVTATRVWELLASPRTSDDLLGTLSSEFDAPAAEMARDLEVLLADFAKKELVEREPAAPPGMSAP